MFKECMRAAYAAGYREGDEVPGTIPDSVIDEDFEPWFAAQKFEGIQVQERIATALERIASAVVDPNDPYVRAHLNVSK